MSHLSLYRVGIVIVFSFIIEILYSIIIEKKVYKKLLIIRTLYLTILLCITVVGRGQKDYNLPIQDIFATYRNVLYGIKYAKYDVINNILLFVPASILFKKGKHLNTIYKILSLSFVLELSQLLFKCGLFEVCDLIDNVLGGMLGMVLIHAYRNIKHNQER